jgi:hypothetical protein
MSFDEIPSRVPQGYIESGIFIGIELIYICNSMLLVSRAAHATKSNTNAGDAKASN